MDSSCFILLFTLLSIYFHSLVGSCNVTSFALSHEYDVNNWEGYIQPNIIITCNDAEVFLGGVYISITERRLNANYATTRSTVEWLVDGHFTKTGNVYTSVPSEDDKLIDGEYAIPGIQYNMTLNISTVYENQTRIETFVPATGVKSLIIPPNPVEELTILITNVSVTTVNYTIRYPSEYDGLAVEVWIDNVKSWEQDNTFRWSEINSEMLDLPIPFDEKRRYDVFVWLKAGDTYSEKSEASYIPHFASSCDVTSFTPRHEYRVNSWEGYIQPYITITCNDADVFLGGVYISITEGQPIPLATATTRTTKEWLVDGHFAKSGNVYTSVPSDDDKLLDGEYARPGTEYNITLNISAVDKDQARIGTFIPTTGMESLIIQPNPVDELVIIITNSFIAIGYTIRLPGYYDALTAEVWIDNVEKLEPIEFDSNSDIDSEILDLPTLFDVKRQYDVSVRMVSGGIYSEKSEASYIPPDKVNRSSKDELLKIMLVVLVSYSVLITACYPYIR